MNHYYQVSVITKNLFTDWIDVTVIAESIMDARRKGVTYLVNEGIIVSANIKRTSVMQVSIGVAS